jgi:hypothetical protein
MVKTKLKSELTLSMEELLERVDILRRGGECNDCDDEGRVVCVNCKTLYCFEHSGCTECT